VTAERGRIDPPNAEINTSPHGGEYGQKNKAGSGKTLLKHSNARRRGVFSQMHEGIGREKMVACEYIATAAFLSAPQACGGLGEAAM
jgi:hypothetical protein